MQATMNLQATNYNINPERRISGLQQQMDSPSNFSIQNADYTINNLTIFGFIFQPLQILHNMECRYISKTFVLKRYKTK
ncbi:unnamed protein product [Acanthoscelides obtectus]|uniref:Uncharacterized protein n=1 Tax=Acanthoscelides obtectus TaxID=200917 RepID=A0A9P0P4H8_ACAOB|nr:unnamed protein product [Acanthoscelides obtectus]CAK1655981.1 hypothetical protein AOBTE_LOCUS19487 [Acanthoscelides obtectus]